MNIQNNIMAMWEALFIEIFWMLMLPTAQYHQIYIYLSENMNFLPNGDFRFWNFVPNQKW